MIQLLEYNIFNENLEDITLAVERKIINTINPNSYRIAKHDKSFQQALRSSSILLPDGIGIVRAVQILYHVKIERITGFDLHQHLLNCLDREKKKCFYLGSKPETLKKIQERINVEHPGITVESYSPPFKSEFSSEDNKAIIDRINSFKPDVLFIGMTAPKQEKWVYQNQLQTEAKVICSIGAVFDYYTHTVNRPNQWMINHGLEWLGRLSREPRRLWKRTFISGPIFMMDVFKECIRNRSWNKKSSGNQV